MRGYSPRFNEKTVKVGRSIELRKGYMKEGAIWGVITEFHITNNVHELPLTCRIGKDEAGSPHPLGWG